MRKITFQRTELYEKVWTTPLTHLKKEYEISTHQLSKVCKELNIPTPSNGNWSKLRHGKDVTKVPLPDSSTTSFTLTVTEPKTDLPKVNSTLNRTITVPKKLSSPHSLVREAQKNIDTDSLNRFNRIEGGSPLDLSVSPDNVDRALRILDTILKECERHGYSIHTYSENNSSWTYIKVDKEKVYLQLREEGKRRKRNLEEKDDPWEDDYEYTPTGKIRLYLLKNKWTTNGRKTISDTSSKNVEERLDELFVKLEHQAEELKKRKIKIQESNKEQEQKRKTRAKAARQHEEELKRYGSLEQQAESFNKSQHISELVKEVIERKAQHNFSSNEALRLEGWIRWAENHARELDPVEQIINDNIR